MFSLAASPDSFSPDFRFFATFIVQEECLHQVDLHSWKGKSILSLSMEEARELKAVLNDLACHVSMMDADLGKISIEDDFEKHMDLLVKAVALVEFFGSRYLSISSFYMPLGDPFPKHRFKVLDRLGKMISLAENSSVVLTLENSAGMYADSAERCLEILTELSAPKLRFCFVPGQFVLAGVPPASRAYPLLRKHIAYVRAEDCSARDGKEVLPGKGDAHLKSLFASLVQDGYNGFVSVRVPNQQTGDLAGKKPEEIFHLCVESIKLLSKEP